MTITIFTDSTSKYLIPTENQILEALFAPGKDINIESIKCVPITQQGKPKIVYPLIQTPGNYQFLFELNNKSTSNVVDINKQGLTNSISACVISLKNHKNGEIPVDLSISEGRIRISYQIIAINDLQKLVIKVSDKIIYSKILIIYDKLNAPCGIALEIPEKSKIFAALDPGLMISNKKLHKKILALNKKFNMFKGNYALYIFKVIN